MTARTVLVRAWSLRVSMVALAVKGSFPDAKDVNQPGEKVQREAGGVLSVAEEQLGGELWRPDLGGRHRRLPGLLSIPWIPGRDSPKPISARTSSSTPAWSEPWSGWDSSVTPRFRPAG